MAEKKDWATPSLREVIFWKDEMTVEEYEREREYYYKHLQDVKNGTYKPLWKQKLNDEPKMVYRSTYLSYAQYIGH